MTARKARGLPRLAAMAGLTLFLSAFFPAGQTHEALAAEAPKEAAGAPAGEAGREVMTVTPDHAFVLVAGEAEKGNVDAMLNLGSFYERGIGIGRNYGKAREWYQKAADAGNPTGLYNVGVCYEIGMGTEVDMAKALEYYQKSDAAGFAPASFKLFSMYINGGVGVPRNEATAVQHLRKGAESGDANALGVLGIATLYGHHGIKKDGPAAVQILQKSAEAGNVESVKNLGVVYKDGIEVKADPAEALKWYLIAQKAGYPAQAIDGIIQDLQTKVGKKQAAAAEKQATDWLAKRTEGGRKEAPKK